MKSFPYEKRKKRLRGVGAERDRDKEVRIHGPTAKSSGVNERGNAALIVMDSHNCYD